MAKPTRLADLKIKKPEVPKDLEKVIERRQKSAPRGQKESAPLEKVNVQLPRAQIRKLDYLKFRLKKTKLGLMNEALELLFRQHAQTLKDMPRTED